MSGAWVRQSLTYVDIAVGFNRVKQTKTTWRIYFARMWLIVSNYWYIDQYAVIWMDGL